MAKPEEKIDFDYYIAEIVEKLKELNPYKIILFGSCAWGTPNEYSDIDLLVVLNKNEIPKNYRERMNYKLFVRNKIIDLSFQVPIDLIVYTKPMYKKFNELGSLFSKEILTKGKILYEAKNERMA